MLSYTNPSSLSEILFSFILLRLIGGPSCWPSWRCPEWWAAPSASAAVHWTHGTFSDFLCQKTLEYTGALYLRFWGVCATSRRTDQLCSTSQIVKSSDGHLCCVNQCLCVTSHLGKRWESPVIYGLLLLLPNVGRSDAPQRAKSIYSHLSLQSLK